MPGSSYQGEGAGPGGCSAGPDSPAGGFSPSGAGPAWPEVPV